jgi:hypothetical protein
LCAIFAFQARQAFTKVFPLTEQTGLKSKLQAFWLLSLQDHCSLKSSPQYFFVLAKGFQSITIMSLHQSDTALQAFHSAL